MKSMSNTAMEMNFGDMLATFLVLGFSLIPIILVVFFYKVYKKNVKLTEERLKNEKQQMLTLQKQVEELNERVSKLESLLKK